MEPIKLRKAGEDQPKQLPKGIRLLVIGGRAMFVKSYMGKLFPVSDAEQIRLKREYGN